MKEKRGKETDWVVQSDEMNFVQCNTCAVMCFLWCFIIVSVYSIFVIRRTLHTNDLCVIFFPFLFSISRITLCNYVSIVLSLEEVFSNLNSTNSQQKRHYLYTFLCFLLVENVWIHAVGSECFSCDNRLFAVSILFVSFFHLFFLECLDRLLLQ